MKTPAQLEIHKVRRLMTYKIAEWDKGNLSDDELLDTLRVHCADMEAAMKKRLDEMVNEVSRSRL